MTPRQIELARHALGLSQGCLRSRRNHYVVRRETANADFVDWIAMEMAGFAARIVVGLPADLAMFHLTRAGAERALLPGDVLDPEDWP